ncbi:tetratricopeptide repeat-containing diguanylate cyclase [Thalassotalea piscium]
MKLFTYYPLLILCLFIQVANAQASNKVLQEAKLLQYSDPKAAITLLSNNSESLSLMSNNEFLEHQFLLLRLAQKVEENELAESTFQQIDQRLAKDERFQPWVKIIKSSLLLKLKQTEADELLKSIPAETLITASDNLKMWFYYLKGELKTKQNLYESALLNLNRANGLANKLNNKYIQMKVITQLIVIEYYRKEYLNALDKTRELQKLAQSLSDEYLEVYALSSRMNVYYMMSVEKQKLLDNTDDKDKRINLINARNEYQQKSKQVMEITLEKSRRLGALQLELRALISLQNQYLEQGLYDKTVNVAKQTIARATKKTLLYEKAVSYNNMSIAHRFTQHYEAALTDLKEAEIIYREVENEHGLLWILEDYSLTYEAYGKPDLALSYYKKLHQATISLQNKTNSKKVIELQETFQNEKNIHEIERLKQQHQLNTAKIEAEEFQKFIFVAFGIMLLIIIFFNIRHSRMITTKNQLLDEFNAKLKEQTLKDPLTGLYNRRLLNEIQEKLSRNAIRRFTKSPDNNQNIGLVILDIDLFKTINDNYGHDIGDSVLAEVSTRLLAQVREDDYVIRWGGEEFLIILTDTTKEGIQSFCQRLIDQSNEHPITMQSHKIDVTFSLGFSLFPLIPEKPTWFSWNETIKLIDNCLYIAKNQGRNQAVTINIDSSDATDEQKVMLLETINDNNMQFPANVQLETIKPTIHV